MREEGRRKYVRFFCSGFNGCNGCKSVGRGKKEEGRGPREEEPSASLRVKRGKKEE
ncbi:hypothetical protein IQ269_02640 [Tychonema sp. LEGE 07199]|uniref:hypothetical protein n=1 Tax=unclassified Tychonema TaxID=2642144 RepID=UPI00187E7ACD|nr:MULTISPECIES: hypothetical protein [unclassified Tychonema]MBE9119728.1 hypothetical protein [Tychonema sp. LEGE 07199]MBE9131619.1 hypothetical protein [Tychonema sp. LEGE 07196]